MDKKEGLIVGRNAVMQALESDRTIDSVTVAEGQRGGQAAKIIEICREKRIPVKYADSRKLDKLCGGAAHQGVAAFAAAHDYAELDDIFNLAQSRGESPFIVICDGLEDPHNLGAILRTADAAGVHGVLIPKHRSCPLSATVAKTSAGAVEHVPVARVGNLVQTIKKLKQEGLWVAAADMDGKDYYDTDLTGPLLLIIGSEGQGVGRLVKEQCDFVVRIPMVGKINSLNASVAGSILMYEAMKQRRKAMN